MLGKVFKYEMRSTARFMLPLTGAVLGLTLLLFLAKLVSQRLLEEPSGTGAYVLGALVYTFAIFFSTFLLAGISFVFIVVLAVRFYQAFNGAEAYTTFALPVKVSTLLWGRVLCGLVYSLLGALCIMLVFPLALPMDEVGNIEVSSWYIQGLGSGGSFTLGSLPTGAFVLFFILMFLAMAISLFTSLLQIYASVAVGGQFGSSRIPLTVAAYFVISTVESIISLVVLGIAALIHMASKGGIVAGLQSFTSPEMSEGQLGALALESFMGTMLVGLGISILFGVVHFLLCRWLYTRRLNLV